MFEHDELQFVKAQLVKAQLANVLVVAIGSHSIQWIVSIQSLNFQTLNFEDSKAPDSEPFLVNGVR